MHIEGAEAVPRAACEEGREMNVLRNFDGTVMAVYLDIEDMPPCRACGCAASAS